MKKIIQYLIGGGLTLAPVAVFAAGTDKDLHDIIVLVIKYFQQFIYLIMGLAFMIFVWNVFRYFFYETEKRKEAGMYVMYSTIGFFVILSFWGLVNILLKTFQLNNTMPNIPFVGQSVNLDNGSGGSGKLRPLVPDANGGADSNVDFGHEL